MQKIKVKATYIGPKDFTGFIPGDEYILTITHNQFTKESTVKAEKENLKAKYGSLNAFFLNFDNVSKII